MSNDAAILAEGYVNFGIAGALAFPCAVAVTLRAFHERVLGGFSAFYLILYAWLLGNIGTIVRGIGPVISAAVITVVFIYPLWAGRGAMQLPKVHRGVLLRRL